MYVWHQTGFGGLPHTPLVGAVGNAGPKELTEDSYVCCYKKGTTYTIVHVGVKTRSCTMNLLVLYTVMYLGVIKVYRMISGLLVDGGTVRTITLTS